MDSLRYWVIEMHVDGFRFDLASALARELHEVDQLGAFFDIIHQDPVLSQVKLIAEPWDLGEGGYQVGNFPVAVDRMERQVPRLRPPLLEGRRRHGLGVRHAALRAAATSTSGAAAGRTPASTSSPATTASRCTTWSATTRSTTRPTARTTATARTTTISWNCGVEGPDRRRRRSLALRERQKRNFLATLLLSQGVPMIRGGDELGHTQQRQQQRLLPGQRAHLARLEPRRRTQQRVPRVHAAGDRTCGATQPVLQRRKFLPGPQHPRRRHQGHLLARPDGEEMTDEAWNAPFVRCLGVRLAGDAIEERPSAASASSGRRCCCC